MLKKLTRSEIRTKKTQANAALAAARSIARSIETIMNSSDRGTERHKALKEAYAVASATLEQAEATLQHLKSQANEAGSYKKGKRQPDNKSAVEASSGNVFADVGLVNANGLLDQAREVKAEERDLGTDGNDEEAE